MPKEEDDQFKSLHDENKELQARLTIAQAFINVLRKAFDALLYHRVNFRDLPEYSDDEALERAQKLGVSRAKARVLTWLGRMERSIDAAVRRKQFRKMDD